MRAALPCSLALLVAACGGDDHATDDRDAGGDRTDADAGADAAPDDTVDLADPDATAETRALFQNLRELSAAGQLLFGQEFPTDFESVAGLDDDPDTSDCRDVVGQHPALHGSDFHYFLYKDAAERAIHTEAVRAAQARGAVVTFDWHMYGRYEESYAATPANAALVAEIAADRNGARAWFLGELDRVVEILADLERPVIFRPFHEMNGDWFWWGNAVDPADYQVLFRLTVDHLRARGVHHVLYAWSPNVTADFARYPGDAYVDVLGIDGYEPGSVPYFTTEDMVAVLGELVRYADAHGKLAAFTETGQRNGYPDVEATFWTERVLAPILADPDARRIAWILTWINSTWSGPYLPHAEIAGTPAGLDFVDFFEHAATLFEDDLPPMYE
jgi:mannan endo-1,4-beta-mannosidase